MILHDITPRQTMQVLNNHGGLTTQNLTSQDGATRIGDLNELFFMRAEWMSKNQGMLLTA
jgi:hypothetical protein